MEIKDLIGQSRTCFEKARYQGPKATWIVEAGEVLRSCCCSLAGELQEPVLMDELAEVRGQFETTNMLQPFDMKQDILRGGSAWRRAQPCKIAELGTVPWP